VIHAKSDHTDKDILSKSVSTLAFYAPNFSVVTSKPLDTSYVYSYAFKYVEETALTVDLNGTKQAYTLALDSTHATTEKDPSGKTIYAYTASSSFTGLSPATSYPLKITASSALFPEASLHDETIKTNAFTKPDLAIASVTPSDSNILCGFTMTYVETTTVVVSDGTDSETVEFAYDGSATGSTDQNERVLNTIQFQKDFTGLTKKQTYPITLTVSSAHVPSFLLYSSSALATGELTTPAIVSSTSTPSPTSVAFTYHLRYIRETTAIVSLDTTRQSFVIPLENANKRIGSLDEYGNTYYESDISGTFEGLPSGTTYILKIDMSDATYPLNTVATTSIETTEIPTVVSPVLTCPSNDLSYQFTIRYIEEVDLTAKASGGKDERETGFTCGLDEQYKTSDTDSHGNSIYQQTIKGTWRYLYTSTAYAVQLTASSTHYSHAIIYSGNITTGTDTAPSISGTASVDYATSTASLTLGIIALIIGLGAQSLISDIIAGLNIVFEDEYKVGDIVVVDDFRGTIQEIGLTTTKIVDPAGNVKIINNSQISTVVNLSDHPSVAACLMYIDYDEDLVKIEKLIERQCRRDQEAASFRLDAPKYIGVSALQDGYIELKMICHCKEENRFQTERDMNRAYCLLFLNNNVIIRTTSS
jgi:hypothetical protein